MKRNETTNSTISVLGGTSNIDVVDKIFHTADIHIRTLKRHNEYRDVFQRLYNDIESRKTENSLIVVAGDVVHAKTDMSPELIVMVSDFFQALADLCHTIVIPGNHDCSLNNLDRMDALSPIVKNLALPRLHYIKSTKLFRVGQCVFSHFSQYDGPDVWIPADQIPDQYRKIALYHGIVDQAKTDTGFVLESDHVTSRIFRGFHAGMIGDIHKRQFVDVARNVAYPGSLIQQNHGEKYGNHGYVVWDAETMIPEFVDIDNEYGYYTLKVENGAIPLFKHVPDKPRFRVQMSNTAAAEKKRVIADIRKFYDVDELTVNRTAHSVNRNGSLIGNGNGSSSKLSTDTIKSPEYQLDLIKDYVKRNYGPDEIIMNQISEINESLNRKVDKDSLSSGIQWSLKRFEFSNMFSYGEDNVIDFTGMEGVMGLFAENASGKSSILDAISFCLFDKCSRTYKSSKILNNQSEWFHCKAVIEINETEYVIEREAETRYGRVPVDVSFYKKTESGDTIDLSGEQRRDTNAVIRDYIGEYEDFVMTAMSTQEGNTVFIEKSQSERKDTLSRFIGIDVFDELHGLAKDKIRDVKSSLRNYENKELSSELAKVESQYEENTEKYVKCKQTKQRIERIKQDIESEILNETREMGRVSSEIEDLDIDHLEATLTQKQDLLDDIRNDIKHAEIKVRENQQPLTGYKSMLDDVDVEHIKNQYQTLNEWQDKLKKKRQEQKSVASTINNVKDTIDHLQGHEFDPTCEYCIQRNQRDAEKLKKNKSKLETLNARYDVLSEWIAENTFHNADQIKRDFKNVSKWQNKVEKFESRVSDWKNKVNQLKVEEHSIASDIQDIKRRIDKYNQTKKEIRNKRRAQKRIDQLNSRLDGIKQKLDDVSSSVQRYHSNIKVAEQEQQRIQQELAVYSELDQKYQAYDYYLEAVKRDGVPYELIDRTMPVIEQEVNNILSQIVDFSLNIELDGKNINAYIVYNADTSWALEIASNFERFVSGLAIRVALISIANLPCPNFLAIDEGFSVADSTNLNNMGLLFEYMRDQFEFVVVISHLDMMRDMVNGLIEIGKTENGFSKVSYI